MSTLLAQTPAPLCQVNRPRYWQAFVSALSIELLLLFLVVMWLTVPPQKIAPTVVPLTMDLLDSEKSPVPEKPRQALPPPPVALPQLQAFKAALKPVQVVQMSSQTTAAAAPAEAPLVASVANLPSQSTVAATPPPAAAAATPPLTVDQATAFNAKLAAAVQAAFELPAAASALNFKGRARIEFSLREGVATAIRVVASSGLGAVDRAAVKAVQSAVYPPPPDTLQSRESPYQIWVACY